MRNIQRLIIFLFLISLCNAQTRVAVIDFEAKGVSEIEVSALTDRLRDELFKTGQYKVMERAMMEEILKEQGFQLSGCTSDECVIEIGKLIGVEQIIGGSISKVGNVFSVSSRMISVETSEVSRVANYDFTGDIGTLLTQGMKNAAIQLATGKAIESEQVIKIGEGTGILYITSEPSGSEVWVDDKKVEGTTPLIAENQPEGKHKIYFCKGDYTGEVEVDLQKDDLKKVNAILQLGYGNLKVITQPFEAIVTIDGEPAGKSPLILKDLKAGTYKLSIYKDGYSPLSTEIFVKANQTVEFKEALQKLATVKIMSFPENATVIFDGEVIGSTPLTRETDSGIHILSISKTGYYTNELDVELKPDEKKELQIKLEKHKGVLNITSKPSGAVVSINGETRGKTPITLDNLHIGNYQIKIEKSDYVTLEKNVTIEVDSIKSIHADLFKKPSFFTLNSDPSGAEIFIDGKNIGKSPVSKQIAPGSHHVTVKMAEYYTKELDIELKPDEKKEL
ncbi:PEGA domain-containing protein, partial [bacterium]|nr:PEGA domain-containing protein [bacterium]